MGATQFRLACALGLRETHKLLDFGCGSLRAGRLMIPYLGEGCYFGIEPNRWLVEKGLAEEVGDSLVRKRRPQFRYVSDFDARVFGTKFDFIVAQSIFSHAGRSQITTALSSFRDSLEENGLVLATFIPSGHWGEDNTGNEWVYPGCVYYSEDSIAQFARESGLEMRRIPWFHPRQNWYLFARTIGALPSEEDAARHLTGVVLRDPSLRRELV